MLLYKPWHKKAFMSLTKRSWWLNEIFTKNQFRWWVFRACVLHLFSLSVYSQYLQICLLKCIIMLKYFCQEFNGIHYWEVYNCFGLFFFFLLISCQCRCISSELMLEYTYLPTLFKCYIFKYSSDNMITLISVLQHWLWVSISVLVKFENIFLGQKSLVKILEKKKALVVGNLT